jgi:hypothetical protein
MIQPSNIRCNGPGLQPCLPGPQFWLNQVGDTGNMPCPPGRSAFSLGCMNMDSKILLNHLYELEIELHQIEVRNDKNRLDELLHESFIEVGRFTVPVLCFLAITIIAVSVMLGKSGGLYWLVSVMITLISGASNNSRDLLVRLRETTTEC